MFNRRQFVGRSSLALLALACGGSFTLTGCAVWDDIKKYAPVGLKAFLGIVGVLSGAGVITVGSNAAIDAIVTLITTGFNDLSAAVDQYDSNKQPGALATISNLLTTISTNIGKFLGDLNIPDQKLLALVTGLSNVILSTLAGFVAALPGPLPSSATHQVLIAKQSVQVVPKRRSVRQFKHDYNSIAVNNGHPEIEL